MTGGGAERSAGRHSVLLALSEELADLSATALSVQSALGQALHGGSAAPPTQVIWNLQEVDRLQQTLADLSAVLREASRQSDPVFDVDLLADCARLGRVREILHSLSAKPTREAGFVEMF